MGQKNQCCTLPHWSWGMQPPLNSLRTKWSLQTQPSMHDLFGQATPGWLKFSQFLWQRGFASHLLYSSVSRHSILTLLFSKSGKLSTIVAWNKKKFIFIRIKSFNSKITIFCFRQLTGISCIDNRSIIVTFADDVKDKSAQSKKHKLFHHRVFLFVGFFEFLLLRLNNFCVTFLGSKNFYSIRLDKLIKICARISEQIR